MHNLFDKIKIQKIIQLFYQIDMIKNNKTELFTKLKIHNLQRVYKKERFYGYGINFYVQPEF